MIVLPEVLQHIGAYLDNSSLLACTLVSRHWKEVFEPCFWSSIDSNYLPWFWHRATSTRAKYRQRVSTLVQQHRQHIRDVKVRDETLLCMVLEANPTGLLSLLLDSSLFRPPIYVHSMFSLASEEWGELIPEAAFDKGQHNGRSVDCTRAFWRLAYMNPELRRLTFPKYEGMSGIAGLMANTSVAANGAVTSSVLTPTSESFLFSMFARLRSLRHLQVGQRADEFLFCNLSTLLPNLESFVHTEMVDFNPRTVQFDPHKNLRSLKFICTISHGQLRAVVAAFPGLEVLSLRRLQDNHHLAHYFDRKSNAHPYTDLTGPQWTDDLVHSSLMHLAIDDMIVVSPSMSLTCGLLQSRTLYPHVTKLVTNVLVRCALDLGRVLYTLPSALSLQISRAKDTNEADGELDEAEWQCSSPFLETWGRDHAMVKDLHIGWINLGPSSEMDTLYVQMPLLTRLKLAHCSLDGATLSAFARNFKNLEDIEFNLDESFSKELLELLVGCPKLKYCGGKGHVATADDIVNSPKWTCRWLERLDIVVVGVPRLTKLQEKLLENMQDQGILELTQTTTVTAEEQEALDHRQESYTIQRKVYRRLGRHKHLRGCNLGTWRTHGSELKMVEDSLELTLASGLDELSGLAKLEYVSFSELNHRIGKAEDAWVKERWYLYRNSGGNLWHRRV